MTSPTKEPTGEHASKRQLARPDPPEGLRRCLGAGDGSGRSTGPIGCTVIAMAAAGMTTTHVQAKSAGLYGGEDGATRRKVQFPSGDSFCVAWHYRGTNGGCGGMGARARGTKEAGARPFSREFPKARVS